MWCMGTDFFTVLFNDPDVDNEYLAQNENLTPKQFQQLLNDSYVNKNNLARNPAINKGDDFGIVNHIYI